MKIFLAQQNYLIGDLKANTDKIITAIRYAQEQGGNLIVFSELAICGYPPMDLLTYESFINACEKALDIICQSVTSIAVLIGAPSRNKTNKGKRLYNSAFLIRNKNIQQIIHKSLLPDYDVFDEGRYFEPGNTNSLVVINGKKIAVTICEDIWNVNNEEDSIYSYQPLDALVKYHPDFIVNISASPFDYTQLDKRKNILYKNSKKYGLPIIYCNSVGGQTDLLFDGASMVVDSDGIIKKQLSQFEEALECVEIFSDGKIIADSKMNSGENIVTTTYSATPFDVSAVHDALIFGIREYFSKMNFEKAIVASSGGIDSALTLALACKALGSKNVHALLLPSQYSSNHSVEDALTLSHNLKTSYDIIPIQNIYATHEKALNPLFHKAATGITEENLQSRIRGTLVMALSNKWGHILLNTSNKSELATGYGTLYGDMAGGLSVLGDVYKTQVYALARYINCNEEIIPCHIITKPPSAELRPEQKDSDSLPDYDLLDEALFWYIEGRKSPEEMIALGIDEELAIKTRNWLHQSEYKRAQFCPILRISPKAFGIGRKIPIVKGGDWNI